MSNVGGFNQFLIMNTKLQPSRTMEGYEDVKSISYSNNKSKKSYKVATRCIFVQGHQPVLLHALLLQFKAVKTSGTIPENPVHRQPQDATVDQIQSPRDALTTALTLIYNSNVHLPAYSISSGTATD
ncbi:uncharacterized protein LOC117282384 [Cryptotermes secundus]|uniref:uncharacterized protein LOC117282384 n=1 Tax=Cryptotermes secundus TaxID=105785 RepID=UPI001454E2FD|nr:uncharacterized protein LOC117282384 [Cryptotermes secundus]